MHGSRPMKRRSVPGAARRSSHAPGSIRNSRRSYCTTRRARSSHLDFSGGEAQHIVVVENTPAVHNLVVCTLCSCYPWGLLGLPPRWYKAAPYRARSVIDPRSVLAEFGLALGDEVEVRVWDSTAEIRYLVLPERPAGIDDLGEAALAELVTRDAMIGVAKVEKGRTA